MVGKHNCENCIHKVVCALWEIQNELCDCKCVHYHPAFTLSNDPLTWEELKAETKINPVYSIKYGWIFPSTVKDEPYKQIWFFTSKGFAQTELFYRDTFYRRLPEENNNGGMLSMQILG